MKILWIFYNCMWWNNKILWHFHNNLWVETEIKESALFGLRFQKAPAVKLNSSPNFSHAFVMLEIKNNSYWKTTNHIQINDDRTSSRGYVDYYLWTNQVHEKCGCEIALILQLTLQSYLFCKWFSYHYNVFILGSFRNGYLPVARSN